MNEITPDTSILYHVTLAEHVLKIMEDGVDPEYSLGKMEVSWYVNKHQLAWAIMHVALIHDCKLDEIYVCAVMVEWKSMRRTARPGRYYTARLFKAENCAPACWFIDDITQ